MTSPPSSWRRVQRVLRLLREHQVAGRWVTGTTLGPGVRDRHFDQRVNLIWGPDGFVIEVTPANGKAAMTRLNKAGARRPVLVTAMDSREMVRLPLSDFLDLLAVYTQWLAQEGRLGQDE